MTNSNRITLELLTEDTQAGDVYVAGNFNGWAVKNPAYKMERIGKGRYRLDFALPTPRPEHILYKYTRGSWQTAEQDGNGHDSPNRQLMAGQRIRRDIVAGWRSKPEKTFAERHPIIEIIDSDFPVPEWVKTRRVAALLPHDYYESDKRYPVLLLQDGQNLFDDFAPYGNWALDHKLALLAEKGHHEVIVIAIDHSEHERIVEYTPSVDTKLGIGEGEEYVRFLVDVLKPEVDKRFRTKPGRLHWGIGGSSMGGLAALYAGLIRSDVFSKMMIFSPSLWVVPDLYEVYLPKGKHSRFYMYAGGKESKNLLNIVNHFKTEFFNCAEDTASVEYKEVINPEGTHSEYYWGEAFPDALSWLYFS